MKARKQARSHEIPPEFDLAIDPREVSKIIESFIRQYVMERGQEGVVIGMSGGIDSCVAAALCARALGKDKVLGLMLPERNSSAEDMKDAALFCRKLGIRCECVDISEIVDVIAETLADKPDAKALANIKARARMIVLYYYANTMRRMVAGTSNKSELLVGYFTKYGDGGSDFMPIGDIYKAQVRQLAAYLKIPERIISKPPTAGLWRRQTDEGEMGIKYGKLDLILRGLEVEAPAKRIAETAGVPEKEVERIRRMHENSRHKRQGAPIPKIGLKTVGMDWKENI